MLYCSGDQAIFRIRLEPRGDSVFQDCCNRPVAFSLHPFEFGDNLVATEANGIFRLPSRAVSIFRKGSLLLVAIGVYLGIGYFSFEIGSGPLRTTA